MSFVALSKKEPSAPDAVRASSHSNGLRIGAPDNSFEKEAGYIADQVISPGPAGPAWSISKMSIGAPLQRKPSTSEGADAVPDSVHRVLEGSGIALDEPLRADMEQRFGYNFSRVRIHSDQIAAQSARDIGAKAYTHGKDVVFGAHQYRPGTNAGKHLIVHELTHVIQQDRGPSIVQCAPDGIKAASGELKDIDKLYDTGVPVDPIRETTGQNKALALAQTFLTPSQGVEGGEIANLKENVLRDMDKIEGARYRGYQDAISHLNLTQFDEKEQAGDVKSFAISLAGNLLWALSGLVAISPVGPEVSIVLALAGKLGADAAWDTTHSIEQRAYEDKGVSATHIRESNALGAIEASNRAKLSIAIGVVGAMLAQFANGLPEGTEAKNASDPTIRLENQLNTANASLFHALSRSFYSSLIATISASPPTPKDDAQHYAAVTEGAIRHLLFPGYYDNGGAKGNQVEPDVIQKDARDQMLRAIAVGHGKIENHRMVSTKLDEKGAGKLVDPATRLIGSPTSLNLSQYELVLAQLNQAARVVGIWTKGANESELSKQFKSQNVVALSAGWDSPPPPPGEDWFGAGYRSPLFEQYMIEGRVGVHNHWRDLIANGVLELESPIWGWENFTGAEIPKIVAIEIRKEDIVSANIGKNGSAVYSATKFRILARGDSIQTGNHGPVSGLLWLNYNV